MNAFQESSKVLSDPRLHALLYEEKQQLSKKQRIVRNISIHAITFVDISLHIGAISRGNAICADKTCSKNIYLSIWQWNVLPVSLPVDIVA